MKKWISVVSAALMLAMLCMTAFAEEIFAAGSGTQDDPWQIANLEQLQAFADSVNDGSKSGYAGQYITLTADIDLDGIEWKPIGNMADMVNMTTLFLGSFDGQGHKMSNFSMETHDFIIGAGVFGISVGEIKNLSVENAKVVCTDLTSQAIGALVGYNMGSVEGCTAANVDVTGNACVGALIGGSIGPVADCTVKNGTVTLLGDNDFSEGLVQCDVAECGGLIIGGGFGGTVQNCSAQGTVRAEGNEPVGMGGIGGCLEMMDVIRNCTVDVVIESAQGGHAIGGLCGYAGTHTNGQITAETEGVVTTVYPGLIENCVVNARMNVSGATHVGGLVGTGLYYYGEETAFEVQNCTISAEMNGAVTPGAVAGRAEGCKLTSVVFDVTADGTALENEVGETDRMYESADQ